MGITPQHATMIIREHLYKALPETICLIGRQCMFFDYETALHLCRKEGFEPHSCDVNIDRQTNEAKIIKTQSNKDCITDETFFKMLGVKNIQAIDISDYEGAEIILDLNKPIPPAFESTVDFIFGGSVCDNVFDPAMYLKNVNRLLKPGGRLLDQNVASVHYRAYAILPPPWYFDYFVVNRFGDCKIYVFEVLNYWNIYALEVFPNENIGVGCGLIENFVSDSVDAVIGVFIIAEKDRDSTWQVTPTQDAYRSEEEWRTYFPNLSKIRASSRPFWTFKMPEQEELLRLPPKNIPGYRFVGRFF
ncbi:MAG TPA: hypothetical protein PLG59_09470 [bacterium]|nr:hypothetical protein [bacterium]HQP99187.1 hypothetical protein [bacterium]